MRPTDPLLTPFCCVLLCAASAILTAPLAQAQQQVSEPIPWQQFANETTIVLIGIDTGKLDGWLWKRVEESLGPDTRETFQAWSRIHRTKLAALRAATRGEHVYIAVDVPYTAAQSPLRFYLPAGDAGLQPLLDAFALERDSVRVEGDYVAVMPAGLLEIKSTMLPTLGDRSDSPHGQRPPSVVLPPAHRPNLAAALAAVRDQAIQLVVLPPDYMRSTFRDLLPQLPPELGGGPTHLLLDGARWVAIGIDVDTPSVEITIQSESAVAAGALAKHIPTMLDHLFALAEPELGENDQQELTAQFSRLLRDLVQPEVFGDRIRIELSPTTAEGGLAQAARLVEKAIGPFVRQQTVGRFQRIALAMHNYHAAYGSFPPGKEARDRDRGARLSWRVHLLPFLGEVDLYRQFRLDEPWDSDHNRKLLDKMPEVYKPSSILLRATELDPGQTVYLAPVGEDTVFGGDEPTSIRHIADGTSNTLMLVEVRPELAVPWTAPEDYQFDPDDPAEGLAIQDGRFVAAAADGSVRRVSGDLPSDSLLHLFQMNDGQRVEWNPE